MADLDGAVAEIESFNLADLDVSGLDMRLELTTIVPACTLIMCNENCTGNHCTCNSKITCGCNINICECHSLCGVHL